MELPPLNLEDFTKWKTSNGVYRVSNSKLQKHIAHMSKGNYSEFLLLNRNLTWMIPSKQKQENS